MEQKVVLTGPETTLPKAKRDPRIDVLRGLALIMIFIDHVPGNLYSSYTLRMIGFSDASEAFVLISGISAGLAYSHRFVAGYTVETARRIWRRAFSLYSAHLFSTIVVLTLASPILIHYSLTDFADANGISSLWEAPLATISRLFLLSHQISYFNILPLYVVFFVLLPGLLWLGKRNVALMLAVSAAVWFAGRYFALQLSFFPVFTTWYFNPIFWQFLFSIGIAIGIAARRGKALVPFNGFLYAAALGFVVFAAWWRLSGQNQFPWPEMTPAFLADTSKSQLGLPRIINALSLAYVVCYMPLLGRVLALPIFSSINVMGRASLVTFVTGSLIAFGLQILRIMTATTLLQDTTLLLAGLMIQYFVAHFLLKRPITLPSLVVGEVIAR